MREKEGGKIRGVLCDDPTWNPHCAGIDVNDEQGGEGGFEHKIYRMDRGVDEWERPSGGRQQEGPDARNKKQHQTNTQVKIAAKGRR